MTTRRWVWIATITVGLAIVGTTVAELRSHATAPNPRRNADSVSLADAAGSNLVALTVAPPKPGRVRLRVDIIGINPADTNNIAIDATSARGARASTHLHRCGVGCFDGTTNLGGGN